MLRKRGNITGLNDTFTDISLNDELDKSSSKLTQVLHRVDIFPKVSTHAAKRTYLGAFLSFLTIVFICFILVSEFIMFMTVKRVDTLSVDLENSGTILIYVNVSFPRINCMDLSVDTVDVSGEQQINLYHRIHKHAIDEDGTIITSQEDKPIVIGNFVDLTKLPGSPFYCGPCYIKGLENTRDKPCCRTCEDVYKIHEDFGRKPPPKYEIEQCRKQLPGCNLNGVMQVNKVAGNFHFAPGSSFSQEHETNVHHIHEFNPAKIDRFNSSHIIHELAFGEKIPHVKYPLDGIAQFSGEDSALFKYFIKVVPTSYKRGNGILSSKTESYQFSFTKHRVDFNSKQQLMLPGVFFVYDLSPIKISYHDTGSSILHFVVNICALIGGVFVVSGYIDRVLHAMVKTLTKKVD